MGDDGDEPMSFGPILGALVGCFAGWLVDRFVAPYGFWFFGVVGGLLIGAIVVAIRVADEPRQACEDKPQ
jgi:F0F1-type ATP synthase assembly protein I